MPSDPRQSESAGKTRTGPAGPGRIVADGERALPLLGRLWRSYLRKHLPLLLVATALMVVEGSTLGLLSYALEPMFDLVLVGGDGDLIVLLGAAIFGMFFLRAATGLFQRIILTKVGQLSTTELQSDLVSHMMTLDSAWFQDQTPGALIERVQGDTQQIEQVWRLLIQGAARDTIAVIGLAIVAISIDPGWALVAMIGIPAMAIPTFVLHRYLRRKANAIRETSYARSNRLNEIFHGIDQVKLNRLEALQSRRFKEIVDTIVTMNVKQVAGAALLPGMLDIMTGLGFFLVIVLGGGEIVSGEKSVGEFMSFFTAMALAFQPLRRIAALSGVLQTTAASLDRVFSVLDLRPTITGPATPVPAPEKTDIRFENLSLTYGDDPALNGLSFVAEAGKTTALVGPSGAGKSTVFRVLTRLIEPQSGAIRIGGTDVREMDLATLRDLFSVVTQDAPVFDESLRANIVLDHEGVDEAALAHILKDARMDDVVAHMADGLDTRAGPRGSNLSGGQRQRLAIARAMLRDAPILLLDEATSALDTQTEQEVQAALDRLSAARTTLVVAHRLSTIRGADKIVVMERGRVVDEGTHEELLARGGLYAELYRLQFRDDGAA